MKYANRSNGFYAIDGDLYPSVTTILQTLNKPALKNWLIKQGALIQKTHNPKDDKALLAHFRNNQDKIFSRGSELHDLAEAYFKSGALITPLEVTGFYEAFRKFVEKFKIEPIHVEVQVHSKKHNFAGTCDGIFKINGQVMIVDWKTGKGLYPEVELQLSAYAQAAKEMKLVKQTPSLLAVCFKENGEYEYKQYKNSFEIFKAVRTVWDWSR